MSDAKKRKFNNSKKRNSSGNSTPANPDDKFDQKLRKLVSKYKGFDPWEKEHHAKSSIEKEVCHHLDRAKIEHKHRVKRYNVVIPGRHPEVFEPDIIIPHPRIQNRPVVVQALHPGNAERLIPLLIEFKKQLGMKYFVVIVTGKDNLTKIQSDAYDLLLGTEYVSSLPSQLRQLSHASKNPHV